MATIFLTGATGFVGSFVAEQAVHQHHRVICLVRKSSNLQWISGLPVELVTGSFFEPESLKTAITSAEYILHIAGVTKAHSRELYYQGNAETTRHLFESLLKFNPAIRRIVFLSSQAAVGPSPNPEPLGEETVCNPLTDYGKSKLKGEQIARSFMNQLPVTILRPPAVYGPRDADVLNFYRLIKRRLNLQIGPVDQLVSMVYVEDLARGILQAAFSESTEGKIYNICEDRTYFWSHVAKELGRMMNRRFLTIRIPYHLAYLASIAIEFVARCQGKPTILNRQKMIEIKQPYWGLSPRRAQEDFGYQTQVPLSEGLQRTLDWYLSEGWL